MPPQVFKETKVTKNGVETKTSYPVQWAFVQIQQLLLLFTYCLECGKELRTKHYRFIGSALIIDYICATGHSNTWSSSQFHHQVPLINAKIPCVATLCGIRFSHMQHFLELMELPTMSMMTFNKHRKMWLFPVIYRVYKTQKQYNFEVLRYCLSIICGDGQYDSPGYSAKFCTYTIADCETNIILDFIIIQRGQYTGELEKQACQLLLNILIHEEGLNINTFVTDRHSGIGSMMKNLFVGVFHAFDVWHMAKTLLKYLTACGKKHPKIQAWTPSIIRHFWFSCKKSNGDPDLLRDLFHSCLLHVLNIHTWGRRQKIFEQLGTLRGRSPYPQKPSLIDCCGHSPLTKRSGRSTPWFNVGDQDFKDLFKALTKTRFCNDMRKCCLFVHTGKLESFHSMKLQYLPKSAGFEMETSVILTMLAVLQNNEYITQEGNAKVYNLKAWSRASKAYVLKKRTIYDKVSFKKAILKEVEDNIASRTLLPLDLSSYIRNEIPTTFHNQTGPSIHELLDKQRTRMDMD